MSKKIKIVDSPMGSGKTSAAIRLINERSDRRYIFITPYLTEGERITKACAKLRFKDPKLWDEKLGVCNKTQHVTELLRRGENVVTTHVLFGLFTDEIKAILAEQHYTLILDESLSVIDKVPLTKNDWQTLFDTGRVEVGEDGLIKAVNYDYVRGDMYFPLKDALTHNDVYQYTDNTCVRVMRIDTFELFDDVYVLTYMFEAQFQCALFKMNGFEYEYIGVKKDDGYSFTDDPAEYYNPLKGIRDKIQIMNYGKNNAIGNDKYDLSAEWYKSDLCTKSRRRHAQMSSKMRNMIKRGFGRGKRVPKDSIMWTCYKESLPALTTDVFKEDDSFVPCSTRASNAWGDKTNLLYMINRFCDPNLVNFFSSKEITINQDDFALSEMIQWIWRSAIRNGQKIKIYIPSSRMRKLLEKWLDEVN